MLILKPVNGVWYVMHNQFPDGHLAAYTSEDNARAFMQWLTIMKFDIHGLLTRLHYDRLTDADKLNIASIQRASRHHTQVISKQEPVMDRLARQRGERVKL